MIVGLRDATVATCGGKAGTLGRLARAGFRVPDGFVIPFRVGAVPAGELGRWLAGLGDPPVAVRSSARAEDGAAASAAGQHDSFLGVRGAAAVADAVRACRTSWSSERAVAYRRASPAARPFAGETSPGEVAGDRAVAAPHEWSSGESGPGTAEPRRAAEAEMAVLVQRHIEADAAGVLFTGEPARVEASWGLGESVVHGLVTPDAWTVRGGAVAARSSGDKRIRVDLAAQGETGAGRGVVTRAVPAADRDRPCLTDGQVAELIAVGAELTALLGMPLDVEWALARGEIWILQARPITAALPAGNDEGATGHSQAIGRGAQSKAGPATTLTGVPGSAGRATGPARLITGPADFTRAIPGDVIVCRTTDPAWTPLLSVAAAVVTETGGVLSHAAIVARERRIPAVLGVPHALTVLADGEPVTVDGGAGTVSRAARSRPS